MDAVQLSNLCSDGVSFCPIVVNEGFVFGLEPDFQSFNLLGIFFWQDGMFCCVCESVLLYWRVMKVKRNIQLGLYSETSSEDE